MTDRTREERIELILSTPHKGTRLPQHSAELAANAKEI